MALINSNNGMVQISDDALSTIIYTACTEIDGVINIPSSITDGIINIIGKKNISKGISIVNKDNTLTIGISLAIKLNYKIKDVCEKVQQKVKNTVETMTSLIVEKIDINVVAIDVSKEKTNKAQDKN